MKTNMPAIFREYMALERLRTSADGIPVSDFQRWRQLKKSLNRHFRPDEAHRNEDQRESVRVPLKLRVGFETYGEIRDCLMTNLSRGGLFIATTAPLPQGSKLQIRIQIGESGQEIELQGEVASHNSGPGLLSEELGMGVKFVKCSEEQEKAVDDLYERTLQRAIQG